MICYGKGKPLKLDESIGAQFTKKFFVGVAQLFTVTFFLVGWFWSVAWGIKMVLLSCKYALHFVCTYIYISIVENNIK